MCMLYAYNVMGLLSKSKPEPEYRIRSSDAKRDGDGVLLCPRCETNDRTELCAFGLYGQPDIARELRCWNCGRVTKLNDGVLYQND